MKHSRIAICLLAGLAIILLAVGSASATDDAASAKAKADANANTKVTLNAPTLTTVMDRLFGTPDKGLFDGKGSFNFRAENMVMTSAEAATFFTTANVESNLAAAVSAAEALHGQIRLEGTIDGQAFEMRLAGRQLKIDGLTLTASQRESLIAQLRAIDGLKEFQIGAVVDGKQTMTKVQGGHEKFDILGSKKDRDHEARGKSGDKVRVDADAKVNGRERIDGPVRVEGAQRLETTGRIGLDRVTPLGRR